MNNLIQYILDKVANQEEIDHRKASHQEIFKIIFNDLKLAQINDNYQSRLKIPRINCSIVLVSGALNELFTTPIFSRGVEYLAEKFKFKTFFPKVTGTRSSIHNQKLLKEQLFQYMEKNPHEKLWLLCFSKGGLDTLHFLSENQSFAKEHILGVSTIATPILGTENLNHKALQLLNKAKKYRKDLWRKFVTKESDAIMDEFRKSLSKEYLSHWFKRNHSLLPKDLFYTSLAFEANWYTGHIWMTVAKMFFRSRGLNDGIVEVKNALFPDYFKAINLGVFKGHHLVGVRGSSYCQEALLEAHLVFLHHLGLLN